MPTFNSDIFQYGYKAIPHIVLTYGVQEHRIFLLLWIGMSLRANSRPLILPAL